MKYRFSKITKAKGIKRHKTSMTINYGLGIMLFIYLIFRDYNNSPVILKLLLLCAIIAVFFAYKYFLNQTKRVLSSEYEIVNDNLILYEHGKLKKTIQFRNITKFEKASLGYKIFSYQSEPSWIFYGVENEKELVDTIQNRLKDLK
jgi:hypothetical protein